jgi:ankyrin repeat protein
MVALVERGAPFRATGRTALHLAAGAGETVAVRALLDAGADAGARDPEFHATPAQWAAFLRHPEVEALLEGHGDA